MIARVGDGACLTMETQRLFSRLIWIIGAREQLLEDGDATLIGDSGLIILVGWCDELWVVLEEKLWRMLASTVIELLGLAKQIISENGLLYRLNIFLLW